MVLAAQQVTMPHFPTEGEFGAMSVDQINAKIKELESLKDHLLGARADAGAAPADGAAPATSHVAAHAAHVAAAAPPAAAAPADPAIEGDDEGGNQGAGAPLAPSVPIRAADGTIVDANVAVKGVTITYDGPITSTDPRMPNFHKAFNSAVHRLLAGSMDSSMKGITSASERSLLKTVLTQLLLHPEGTVFHENGEHVLPKTLARPEDGATEQPTATALSFVSKIDTTTTMPSPPADGSSPLEYHQWLYYALMQFGKTYATLLSNYVLHATHGVIPAILLENRNCVESQRKFILDMRRLVRNVRECAKWILRLDRERGWLCRGAAVGGGSDIMQRRVRCFADVQDGRFLECLDLKLRAKTLKVEDLTSDEARLTNDEARMHVGMLKVETRDRGDGTLERRIEGGTNQGIVMLCNYGNVNELLGLEKHRLQGLISTLIGQDDTQMVGGAGKRGGVQSLTSSAYTPHAGKSARILISIDEAGTLFSSTDKTNGGDMKKGWHLFHTDAVGENLLDREFAVAEHVKGWRLSEASKVDSRRKRFKAAVEHDEDEDEDEDSEMETDPAASAAAEVESVDTSLDESEGGLEEEDEDEEEAKRREEVEDQARGLRELMVRISCAGSCVFGMLMVDATPFRVVQDRDQNAMASTSTRVYQPEPDDSYFGVRVAGNPQENNTFAIEYRSVPQPPSTRTVPEGTLKLLFLEKKGIATCQPDGQYTVHSPFEYTPSDEGNFSQGVPPTQASVKCTKQFRWVEGVTKEQKKLAAKNPSHPSLPPIEQRYVEPANWDCDITFAQYVDVVKHPEHGMERFLQEAKEHYKGQPQETEYQRQLPGVTAVLDSWDSAERARASHLHLLWAPTDTKTSNYELFYLQRTLLSTMPLDRVQHIHGVGFNGSGTWLQVVIPRGRHNLPSTFGATHLLELLLQPKYSMLFSKRITNAEKLGTPGVRQQFGPCFKIPIQFSSKHHDATLAGKRPAFAHLDKPAIEYPPPPGDHAGDHAELQELLKRAECEFGEDVGIYEVFDDDRFILMFVSKESDIALIESLNVEVYQKKLELWRRDTTLGRPPIHKTITMQSPGLSRGQSVKTKDHGHPVTDLLRTKPFDPKAKKMGPTMTLDEEAQALRLCEKRACVPPEVLAECGSGRLLHGRGYEHPVWGAYRWATDNPKIFWTNDNHKEMLLTALEGTQQLMNTLEAHALEHPSAEDAVAHAIATRHDENGKLHQMLRSPIAYRHATEVRHDEAGARRKMSFVEEVHLPLGGAPRLARKMREKVDEQIKALPAPQRPPQPSPVNINSSLRHDEAAAEADLLQVAGESPDTMVQNLVERNKEQKQLRDQAEERTRQYRTKRREEEVAAKKRSMALKQRAGASSVAESILVKEARRSVKEMANRVPMRWRIEFEQSLVSFFDAITDGSYDEPVRPEAAERFCDNVTNGVELSGLATLFDSVRFPVALNLTDLMEKRDFSEGTDLCNLCRERQWHPNPPEVQEAFKLYEDNMLLKERWGRA